MVSGRGAGACVITKGKDPPRVPVQILRCGCVLRLREDTARLCHRHAHHLAGDCNIHVAENVRDVGPYVKPFS